VHNLSVSSGAMVQSNEPSAELFDSVSQANTPVQGCRALAKRTQQPRRRPASAAFLKLGSIQSP
jgi:hypothetical protein